MYFNLLNFSYTNCHTTTHSAVFTFGRNGLLNLSTVAELFTQVDYNQTPGDVVFMSLQLTPDDAMPRSLEGSFPPRGGGLSALSVGHGEFQRRGVLLVVGFLTPLLCHDFRRG
jgi:hypothetical protein